MARNSFIFISGLCLLLCLVVINLLVGSVGIAFGDVVGVFIGGEVKESTRQIILLSRLPAAFMAILAGCALSVSGLLMQTFFRNPVAGPFIFGISSGASLGVAFILMAGAIFGVSLSMVSLAFGWMLIIAAIVGAMSIFFLMLGLSYKVKSITVLLIVGMMLSSVIGSIISVLQSFSNETALQRFIFWGFGSFRNVSYNQLLVLAPIVVLGIVFSMALSKSLNVVLMGEEYAKSMGLKVQRFRAQVIIITGLLAGSITAFAGPVAFIGLAVPHICRALLSTSDHKVLLPACVVFGAIIALLANVLAALPGIEANLPLNAVTSVIGAPVVIWVLFNKNYRIS